MTGNTLWRSIKPFPNSKNPRRRWALLTVAVVLLLIAAVRPTYDVVSADGGADPITIALADPNLNVFFVVDRSVNSRVEDFGGKSRMSGMRSDISALIDEYPRARFSVISFASRAGVDWPLSDDAWSLQSMIRGLSPYTLVASDAMFQANAGAAAQVLTEKVAWAAHTFPGSHSVVFYFGTGAAGSRVTPASFASANIAGGAVLGYGTEQGGPIPQGWLQGAKVYQSDPSSQAPLNSTLDTAKLRDIAAQLSVPYFHRETGSSISNLVPPVDLGAAEASHATSAEQPITWRELYWLFTALAATLMLGEIAMTIREFRRNRMARRDVAG